MTGVAASPGLALTAGDFPGRCGAHPPARSAFRAGGPLPRASAGQFQGPRPAEPALGLGEGCGLQLALGLL